MRTRLPFLSRRRGLTTLLALPGVEAVYDVADRSTLTVDGSLRVSQMNDISGRARHAIQGTLAAQPLYTAPAGSAAPYITFDGADDFMRAVFTLAQPTWILAAVAQISWTYPDALMDGATANTGKITQDPPASSPSFSIYAGGTLGIYSTALTLGTPGVFSAVFNGTASSLAVNRGAIAAPGANVGTASMGGITIGAQGPGNTSWANLRFYGLAAFSKIPNPTDQLRAINYMISRYNIPA